MSEHNRRTGWRGQCECGWEGEFWERVASPEQADLSHRRGYVPFEKSAHASEAIEDAMVEEWQDHVLPLAAIAGVRAAAREHAQASQRLDKTVLAAKAAGASWADIGRAAGIPASLRMNAGRANSHQLEVPNHGRAGPVPRRPAQGETVP